MDWLSLVGTERCVFHTEFLIAGSVLDYFDGVEKVFVGADGSSVKGKIVKLDNGHVVLADDKKFVELSEPESAALRGMQQSLSAMIGSWLTDAANGGMEKFDAFKLILATLQAHTGVIRGVVLELASDNVSATLKAGTDV